jgi:hypothetical protein
MASRDDNIANRENSIRATWKGKTYSARRFAKLFCPKLAPETVGAWLKAGKTEAQCIAEQHLAHRNKRNPDRLHYA